MNKLVATIHYTTTDSDTAAHERVIAEALEGHGLTFEITDVHCDVDYVANAIAKLPQKDWIQDAA